MLHPAPGWLQVCHPCGSLMAPRGRCCQLLMTLPEQTNLFSKCSHLILGLDSLYSSQAAEAPALSSAAAKIMGFADLWLKQGLSIQAKNKALNKREKSPRKMKL